MAQLWLPDKYPKTLVPRILNVAILRDVASMEISDLNEVMEAGEVSGNIKTYVLMKRGDQDTDLL